jgi:hypothetical protein
MHSFVGVRVEVGDERFEDEDLLFSDILWR